MSEAKEILQAALQRSEAREKQRQPIDYKRLNVMVRRQRAALTRAKKLGAEAVILACRNAVREWNEPGVMWPDDWSSWQRALDDVLPMHKQVNLGDL